MQPDSVIATTVTNSVGKAELVVIARPTASNMAVAVVDPKRNAARTYEPLTSTDGVATKDVSATRSAGFALTMRLDDRPVAIDHVPDVQLGSNSVERGTVAPDLLATAMLAANSWTSGGGPPVTGQRVAIWGGADQTGVDIIAVRIKTGSVADGLLIDWWSPPTPGASASSRIPHEEHFWMSPSAPDSPLAFQYGDGRVGVVVPIPTTFSGAALVVNGNEGPQVTIDGDGFASLRFADADTPADTPVQVDVFAYSGDFLRISLPAAA